MSERGLNVARYRQTHFLFLRNQSAHVYCGPGELKPLLLYYYTAATLSRRVTPMQHAPPPIPNSSS